MFDCASQAIMSIREAIQRHRMPKDTVLATITRHDGDNAFTETVRAARAVLPPLDTTAMTKCRDPEGVSSYQEP